MDSNGFYCGKRSKLIFFMFQSLISTIRHELLHALGFSASLYAFYRDENGDPRTPRGDSGKPPIDFDLRVRKWSENTIKTVILKHFFFFT